MSVCNHFATHGSPSCLHRVSFQEPAQWQQNVLRIKSALSNSIFMACPKKNSVFGRLSSLPPNCLPPPPSKTRFCTVRAEIITELILKRAGPVIFKTFLLELIAFRPIPVICPARGVKPENYWKWLLIPNRAHPEKKSVIFQKLIPGNLFPDPL